MIRFESTLAFLLDDRGRGEKREEKQRCAPVTPEIANPDADDESAKSRPFKPTARAVADLRSAPQCAIGQRIELRIDASIIR